MKKNKVYFYRISGADLASRKNGLAAIFDAARPFANLKENELIPVKITIGDSACVYNIHPELAKVVIDRIKSNNGKPFLFDTNVIYQGQRQNAYDHLSLAYRKGFNYERIGAPFIIADGLLGQDGREFTVSSEEIKRIKVPSFVGMLDNLVVLSHATGHIVSKFAAAIKNVAMGMSCRPTKQVQHSSLKPKVVGKKCTACGCCIKICPVGAIAFKEKKAFIDSAICVGCGECLCACKFDAIYINWAEDEHIFCRRMNLVALEILKNFKQTFFITFALDMTQECDCIASKDDPLIAETAGIFASTDPVSVDKAVIDYVLAHSKNDFLKNNRLVYEKMLTHAASIGLGSLEYDLVEIK